MAAEKMNEVTKLNKGTSRDQWGTLNYFGYKTPDGAVRCRVTPIGDEKATLEVKHFSQSQVGTYRKTLRWDEADNIGSSYIDLKGDLQQNGLKSSDMLDEVNCLIEIHNDLLDEHLGEKRVVKDYKGEWEAEPKEVLGVSVDFSSEAVQTTKLFLTSRGYHGRNETALEETKLFTEDMLTAAVKETLAGHRVRLAETEAFLDEVQAALEAGVRITDIPSGTVGFLNYREPEHLVTKVNELVPEPVEEPATA